MCQCAPIILTFQHNFSLISDFVQFNVCLIDPNNISRPTQQWVYDFFSIMLQGLTAHCPIKALMEKRLIFQLSVTVHC